MFQNPVADSHETRIESKNLVLKVLLEGLYDTESHLSKLQGMHHILKYIWVDVKSFWQAHITLPDPDANWKDYWRDYHDTASLILGPSVTFAAPMGHIDNFRAEHQVDYPGFPAPTGTNINMMPFICGYNFEDCKLPDFIRPYWDLIEMCLKHHHSRGSSSFHWPKRFSSDLGKVYYLTIQESEVEAGQSQRRPGLHVDCPGWVKLKSANEDQVRKGSGFSRKLNCFGWGAGLRACHVFNLPTEIKMLERDLPKENMYVTFGGIYIASNVPDSTRVWDCAVDGEVIGQHGDIEHMRSALGDLEEEGEVMRPGQVYWITDRTPHESLPLKEKTMRQFFRIVTSEVSFWFRDHSTPNPLGVLPDPKITITVCGDKFSEEGVEIVRNISEDPYWIVTE